MQKIHVFAVATLAAASLFAVRAFAGYKSTAYITVVPSIRVAFGSIGDARNSADLNQQIGCVVTQSGIGGDHLAGYCTATDANGTGGFCSLPSTAIDGYLKAIATIQPNSYIYFEWDANYNCKDLEIYSTSNYRPLTP
jgi:hypothetical protein